MHQMEMETVFVRHLKDLLQQRHPALSSPESSQPCEEEQRPGVLGNVEDVIDILFHRKVTAAQTFVLKLFVSFENQILFKPKKKT